jgi:hypothetical protein
MEPQELLEMSEKSGRGLERRIGLSMAIFAALLAVVSLMGHRLHTEEVVLQTKVADGWAYYQAKNTRSQMYTLDARLAGLLGRPGAALATTWDEKATEERHQADGIRHDTEELDRETQATARRATLFDSAEVFLEIAIVLCSIALLTGALLFWKLSFIGAAAGVALAALPFVR